MFFKKKEPLIKTVESIDKVYHITMLDGTILTKTYKHKDIRDGWGYFFTCSKEQLFRADDGNFYAYANIKEAIEEIKYWQVTVKIIKSFWCEDRYEVISEVEGRVS